MAQVTPRSELSSSGRRARGRRLFTVGTSLTTGIGFLHFFTGIAWLGIVIIHPVMRPMLQRDEPTNEPIIHIAGNFGLFFAVLLGLLRVAAFENAKSLADTSSRAASSLSTIYRKH
jgi:hypothetical protein